MTYKYKTKPRGYQHESFITTANRKAHGWLWDPGLGKTWEGLNTCAYLYEQGEIDCMIVVAPSGVHRAWITDELPVHMPDRVLETTKSLIYESSKAGSQKAKAHRKALYENTGLSLVMVSYDALPTKGFKKFLVAMCKKRKVLFILDESHRIKGGKSKCTITAKAYGKYARYRRLMTGTPVEELPDIYHQIDFLDETFWPRHGINSSEEFKNRFCEYKNVAFKPETLARMRQLRPGRRPITHFPKLVGFRDVQLLAKWVAEICHRLTKDDAGLDLPPKVYSKRYFDLSPECRRVYDELDDKLLTTLQSGDVLAAITPIIRILRLQQIACGYVAIAAKQPTQMIEPDKPNRRLELLVDDVLPDLPGQAIIWCKFTMDVNQIMTALGKNAVRYDGDVDTDDRARHKLQFQQGAVKYLVASKAAAEGLNLQQCSTSIYYSNSHVLIKRLQSEDRIHRPGQKASTVNMIDIVANGTVDGDILRALRRKFDLSVQLTQDNYRDWLS